MEYIQLLGSRLTGGNSFSPSQELVLLIVVAVLVIVVVDWIRSSRNY